MYENLKTKESGLLRFGFTEFISGLLVYFGFTATDSTNSANDKT